MEDKCQQIWADYNDALLKYIKHRVGDQFDAEDILQDVYVRIYKNIDSLKYLEKLESWIYNITKNAIIDYYRKKKDTPMDTTYFESKPTKDDSNNNMNDEISRCIGKMIDELPKTQKEAIRQHDINGMKHKEISKQFNISVSSSKMRVLRGKAKLKEILLECCDFEVDTFGNIVDYKLKKDKCTRCNCDGD